MACLGVSPVVFCSAISGRVIDATPARKRVDSGVLSGRCGAEHPDGDSVTLASPRAPRCQRFVGGSWNAAQHRFKSEATSPHPFIRFLASGFPSGNLPEHTFVYTIHRIIIMHLTTISGTRNFEHTSSEFRPVKGCLAPRLLGEGPNSVPPTSDGV